MLTEAVGYVEEEEERDEEECATDDVVGGLGAVLQPDIRERDL